MIRRLLLAALLGSIPNFAVAMTDYIDAAPPTVYEADDTSPQNMDFDVDKNMFVAHSCWYNDRTINYYKFRMYTPKTYPNVTATGAIQKVYIVTTDGGFDGALGMPIIPYHTSDGTNYTDFMEIVFVDAPNGYTENSFKSEGDIDESGATVSESGIFLNMPVVPTNSTLQDPVTGFTAPISPVKVWYKGVEVHTYLFEVTDERAKTLFSFTRSNPSDAYSITVTPFVTGSPGNGKISVAPIWHLNQYSRGVVSGENNGGPSDQGMRNIINVDRPDLGYSPLWQVFWATELPIDYDADDISNSVDFKKKDSFDMFPTPMFVNCPNVGNVGTADNPTMTSDHQTTIDGKKDTNWILGSHKDLIMTPGIKVSFETESGTEIDSTMTNMMGAFEHELQSSKIPEDSKPGKINVVANGKTLRTITVEFGDYIEDAPPTVYEATDMSPQNMDFDKENNMFPAHPCWYNDNELHYYKFRMYTPTTYPDASVPRALGDRVPIQKVYFVTTDGGFGGAIGRPIIPYHTSDGTMYSDFMEVDFVTAPNGYTANDFKSKGDIDESGAAVTASGIYLNIPVVPNFSTLQNPETGGINEAPIKRVEVWYKGVEVHTFVFEVTDESAKSFFSFTRTDATDPDYSITVVDFVSDAKKVLFAPIWHLNQYSRGVVSGENNGGPSDKGMRNIINVDRGDQGYSPLWQVFWATELPINYEADDISNSANFKTDDSFELFATPMFVNCPDVGPVSSTKNPDMTDDHEIKIDGNMESNWIMGSNQKLIMKPDLKVSFQTVGGTEIDSTMTNMMGAFEFELQSSKIPKGATEINVVYEGETINTIGVMNAGVAAQGDTSGSGIVGFHAFFSVTTLACVVAFLF